MPHLHTPAAPEAQLDSLKTPDMTRVFSEKISTRPTVRPELDAPGSAPATRLTVAVASVDRINFFVP